MPIKNKDGTPYKLRHPNPIVKSQTWVGDELVLHNLQWGSEKKEDEKPSIAIEINKTFTNQAVIQEPAIPKEVPVEPKKTLKNTVLFWCQPASIQEKQDELYGDQYKIIKYGEKFTFEALIISREDLTMEIWSKLNINKGSVIYPIKYTSGEPLDEYRWWKIEDSSSKAGGNLMSTIISDYQPDFS